MQVLPLRKIETLPNPREHARPKLCRDLVETDSKSNADRNLLLKAMPFSQFSDSFPEGCRSYSQSRVPCHSPTIPYTVVRPLVPVLALRGQRIRRTSSSTTCISSLSSGELPMNSDMVTWPDCERPSRNTCQKVLARMRRSSQKLWRSTYPAIGLELLPPGERIAAIILCPSRDGRPEFVTPSP
jgi:hypothetical protein